MNDLSVGIFDSGLGGLCAVVEFRRLLKHENLIYFGDTGRVPYGTRSNEKIIEYARNDARFLISKNVKAILCACGTVSSVALPTLKKELDIPVFGTIEPSSTEASKATKNKIIGIMGTGATIASGVFEKTLSSIDTEIKTVSVPCPLLVPIVENGFSDSELSRLALIEYMKPIIDSGADTVILGCTHFPILSNQIHSLYPNLALIDSAAAAARALSAYLEENDLRSSRKNDGRSEYYVSDKPQNFLSCAKIFLGTDNIDIKKTDIESY